MVTGKERRLRRLLGEDGKTLLVAVDHSLTTGVAGGLHDMGEVVGAVVAGGADGIVLHRGSAARDMPAQRETAMIVHLSGSTALSDERDLKIRVCQPEDALALGADAVSVHVTLGCGPREDRDALADLGSVASTCDRLGLPLMVMTYVRTSCAAVGARVVHAARVASELGADIVKVSSPDLDTTHALATQISVPVVVAGGDTATGDWESFLTGAGATLDTGIAGLCVGRWIFGDPNPTRATAELHALVHGRFTTPPDDPRSILTADRSEYHL